MDFVVIPPRDVLERTPAVISKPRQGPAEAGLLGSCAPISAIGAVQPAPADDVVASAVQAVHFAVESGVRFVIRTGAPMPASVERFEELRDGLAVPSNELLKSPGAFVDAHGARRSVSRAFPRWLGGCYSCSLSGGALVRSLRQRSSGTWAAVVVFRKSSRTARSRSASRQGRKWPAPARISKRAPGMASAAR